MNLKQLCVSSFMFAVLVIPAVQARQESKPEKKPRPVPSLETEDVIPASTQVKTDKPVAESKPTETKTDGKSDAKPEAKGSAKGEDKQTVASDVKSDGKTDGDKAEAAKGDQKDKDDSSKVDPAEIEWRERLTKAREMVRQLRQQTQETELALTAIRNDRNGNNLTPERLNSIANAMNNNGQQLAILRQQLSTASQEMEQIVTEGKIKTFHEEMKTPVTEKGEANEEYYKSRYVELVDQYNDADRRIKLYNFRIADLHAQLEGNGGKNGGDNFAGMRIQRDIDQAMIDMDLARADLTKARESIDALTEEARRAGLPPGIFRQ